MAIILAHLCEVKIDKGEEAASRKISSADPLWSLCDLGRRRDGKLLSGAMSDCCIIDKLILTIDTANHPDFKMEPRGNRSFLTVHSTLRLHSSRSCAPLSHDAQPLKPLSSRSAPPLSISPKCSLSRR